MSLLAGLLLRLFAFGVLVALSSALKFDFADVQQCDQVTISFSGPNLTDGQVPASLEVLPINSTAITLPLVEPSLIYSGITLNFLPLAAGADFLTSLDDKTGRNLISVSDIIRVLPSPVGNDSCLPSAQKSSRRFIPPTNVSQCEEFSIQYDPSVVSQPPSVRLYSPIGPSFVLNATSHTVGEAIYLMSFTRGKEAILLMTDENENMETSPLYTVEGDINSNTSCLHKNSSNDIMDDRTTDMPNTPANPEALIIGVAAGGGIIVLIAISMVVFIIRDRRRRCKKLSNGFDPSRAQTSQEDEKRPSWEMSPGSSRAASNPIYTSDVFMSPTRSTYQRGSLASEGRITTEEQMRPTGSKFGTPSQIILESPSERGSLYSLDIEGMLNMATLQSENVASRKNSEATVLNLNVAPSSIPSLTRSAHLDIPTIQTSLRLEPDMRRLRSPSDVPKDFDSFTFEAYSSSPFESHHSITTSILQNSLRPGREHTPSIISPRDSSAVVSSRGRILSGLSSTSFRSSSGWYGIAQ